MLCRHPKFNCRWPGSSSAFPRPPAWREDDIDERDPNVPVTAPLPLPRPPLPPRLRAILGPLRLANADLTRSSTPSSFSCSSIATCQSLWLCSASASAKDKLHLPHVYGGGQSPAWSAVWLKSFGQLCFLPGCFFLAVSGCGSPLAFLLGPSRGLFGSGGGNAPVALFATRTVPLGSVLSPEWPRVEVAPALFDSSADSWWL